MLINKDNFILEKKQTEDEILAIEKNIVDQANGKLLSEYNDKSSKLDLFQFILETAWENNDDISPDEKNLIEKIRNRLNITDYEYRIIEATIGKFSAPENIHFPH